MLSLRKQFNFVLAITLFTVVAYAWFMVAEESLRKIFGPGFRLNLIHVLIITLVSAFVVVVVLNSTIYELPALSVDEALIEGAFII